MPIRTKIYNGILRRKILGEEKYLVNIIGAFGKLKSEMTGSF